MKTPSAMIKISRKMPPIMNRNFMKRSQKSILLISSCSVSGIYPPYVSLIPMMKASGSPFVCFSKSRRGVVSLMQPCLTSQFFPPPIELFLSSISIPPLSSQTSMVSRLLLEAAWQTSKMRMTQESTSCVTEKKVQLLLVTVVAIRVPSTISQAFWLHPPTKPASHAQQLLLRQ